MLLEKQGFAALLLASCALASQWPYRRIVAPAEYVFSEPKIVQKYAQQGSFTVLDEYATEPPRDLFIEHLRASVAANPQGELASIFINRTIEPGTTLDTIWDQLLLPTNLVDADPLGDVRTPMLPIPSYQHTATQLLKLPYQIDPICAIDKAKWFYRSVDGSCNWMEMGHSHWGQNGQARIRDYGQHSYADGISTPREGPNPRAVSNAFFKRKKRLYYEHTPVLLALIEFVMHDVTYSEDSTTDFIDIAMPPDEDTFPLNTTFRVWRTESVPGTGTSKSNPRENINQATTWLDVSSLYGSTTTVSHALRSFKGGKLLTSDGDYLPFNTMKLPMRTRPGVPVESLFAGGDPRTNEDWLMLAVHTLLLRDHNRMCDLLVKQHPDYNDEQIYQTIRLAMGAKFALIANSYQMAYWQTSGADAMPWPRDDGFPLYRQIYGESALEINPVHLYPWPLVTKSGKPMVASAEMAIVYRFHEFIIPSFPLKDAHNKTILEKDLFESAFDAKGFVEAGLENVLRGMVSTNIPNFKSGVDENFRSANKYRGAPFDIVTWSIVHEREQGLPTFNQYFAKYNEQDPAVVIPVRKRFEDFTSDPYYVKELKRLYKTPDDVDLVVGCQLEETLFPGTTVPSSALIISLFSLFGLGNSDRFSVGYAIMRCILVDRPWDCTPSNALEELFWDPAPTKLFPRARKPNTFWLKELDFQAHGTNLLWRLVTENSDIKQLQRNPLFPYDPVTNPILHELPPPNTDIREMLLLAVEVLLQLWGQYKLVIFTTLAGIPAVLLGWLLTRTIRPGLAPLMWKWPVLGLGLDFNRDPVSLVQKGMEGHRAMVFGIDLPNQQQFVIHTAQDMDVITRDGPYERLFSLREFLRSIGFDLIVGSANFESDFHTNLIREHLLNPLILQGFSRTVAHASHQFFIDRPLVPPSSDSHHYDSLNATLDQYIAYVMSRCFAGLNDFDNQALIDLFIKFNADAVKAMGFSTFLPKFLRFLARMPITKDFEAIRKILMPPIARARQRLNENNVKDTNFLNFILPRITDDAEASDMVAILVFVGLTNLQATLSSCVLDIINRNGFQSHIIASLAHANENNISSQRNQPWQTLRSAALESVRLSGPATGPARQLKKSWRYPSSASLSIPAGKAVALSAWYRHREAVDFGGDAAEYKPDRFMTSDPTIGGNQFISWGLNTKHMCPGRWFALQSIQLMVKALLEQYEFVPDKVLTDAEKYKYSGGSVVRTPVGVTVIPRYAT